jgi:hypothetical protein
LHLLDLTDNAFPEESWRVFARSKAFSALAEINLSRTDMSGERMNAFTSSRWCRPVAIQLGACAIGNEGATELANSTLVERLARLDLRHNNLSAAGSTSVVKCSRLTHLKHLVLGYNTLGTRTLRSIADNPSLRGLTVLELCCHIGENHGLEPAHFEEFFTNLKLPDLRYLNLSGRPVGHRASRLLASEKFKSLRRLDLSGCELTDAAVASLLAAPPLQNLIELEVGQNGLKSGVSLLTDPGILPRLSKCNLKGSPLDGVLKRRLKRRLGVTT